MENSFDYGFEYQGSSTRDVMTPLTERVFLSYTQAIRSYTGCLAMGIPVSTHAQYLRVSTHVQNMHMHIMCDMYFCTYNMQCFDN